MWNETKKVAKKIKKGFTMPGKQQLMAEIEEEIVEAKAHYMNELEDLQKIRELLDKNAEQDIANDRTSREVSSVLLRAIESYTCKNYEDVGRILYVASQLLDKQRLEDLRDNIPRNQAVVKVEVFYQKAKHRISDLEKLQKRFNEARERLKETKE